MTYYHADLIGRALGRFVAQKTDFQFQVLVADDCSTDGVQEVIRGYANEHSDIIKLILRGKNIGPQENYLSAAELVRRKYVAICDGDDYFVDDRKLQKQVAVLEADPSLSICYGMAQTEWESDEVPPSLKPDYAPGKIKPRSNIGDLLRGMDIATSTIMHRWRFTDTPIRDHLPVTLQPVDLFLMLLHAEVSDIAFIGQVYSVYWRHSAATSIDYQTSPDNFRLKNGVLLLFFHYYVFRRFAGNQKPEWRERTANRLAGALRTHFKHGRMAELAELANLNPAFFAEFGESVVFEQAYLRRAHRACLKRKTMIAALGVIAIVAVLLWPAVLR
ncbi:glycosyltransferase [Ruegeria arenilitoris]|uniref:glycosyltransferase n=1 Tax=Ruegeria arenilitoris TaxID=1173585 RepID=UPI0028F6DAB6|nr:glycosyltransferase [Ruegeria arenilitoris]